MNLESKNLNKLKCLICNKIYASPSSFSHHKKRYHKNETIANVRDVGENVGENVRYVEGKNDINITTLLAKNSLKCEYCNKIFSSRQNKYEHKKNACKLNPKNTNYNINNNKIELLENENKEIKKSFEELKELLIKNYKIYPKTLQKINKNLINNSNNTTNNNITNNNNTIINKTYVNFNDSINYKLLTENEIINILNRQLKCLEENIKTAHYDIKYPEHNNILIIKDNNAYIFDGIKFSAISKDEAIQELIKSRKVITDEDSRD
jgi:hypothetical protein